MLHSAAEVAMNRVAKVVLEDATGKYRDRLDPSNQKRIYWQTLWVDPVSTLVLIGEEPDYLVAALPWGTNQAAPGIIIIAPRDIVRLR